MDWQQTSALVIVAVAAVGLTWGAIRRRKSRATCKGHCGCAGHPTGAPERIRFHARKGERAAVVVRAR